MAPRCVVVGAGAIGASIAYRLVEAGADVELVDQAGPGAGTSGTSWAWVGASALGLWDYFDINHAGVAAHRRLSAELGSPDWSHLPGSLAWSSDGDRETAIVDRVAELRGAGYAAALLTRVQALELEPWVRIDSSVERVAFYPDEGWVDPRPMIGTLLDVARRRGLRGRWNARVEAIEDGPAVTLASGERLEADVVVVACGRWSAQVAALAGFELPMVPGSERGSLAVGLLVLTTPAAQGLRRLVIADDDSMIRPDGAGRLLLHSDIHDRRVDPAGPPEALTSIASAVATEASAHLRLDSELGVDRAILGIRSLTADLLPAVGPMPGVDGVYLAVTHSGLTLSPVMGELVASEIAGGVEEPLLQPFRPDRFASLTSQPGGVTHGA